MMHINTVCQSVRLSQKFKSLESLNTGCHDITLSRQTLSGTAATQAARHQGVITLKKAELSHGNGISLLTVLTFVQRALMVNQMLAESYMSYKTVIDARPSSRPPSA